jgi:hypothetical protein
MVLAAAERIRANGSTQELILRKGLHNPQTVCKNPT